MVNIKLGIGCFISAEKILRLNKYVQESYGISRRKFVSLIDSGSVFVDGKKIESYSYEVQGGENLEIKGENIKGKIKISNGINIVLFNKPIGYVCSKEDKYNKTIYEILPKEIQNYFYIGRLDKDSRGLLVLTNNSELVNKYQHPSNGVEKEYDVQIDKMFSMNDYKKMKKGILDEGELLMIKMAKYYQQKNKYFIKIVLIEGKKKHIRRMLSSLGYKVLDLVRVREGQFELGNLREGCIKQLKLNS